jgi:succinoglycan biosynthesis transport protein ExoP
MSFNNKVDYMPNQPFSNVGIDPSDSQHKSFQKRKWQVLIGTFLLILIVANAVIWSRAPTYQSQAILHFSYTSQAEQGLAELAKMQITLHQQRLKSNSVLSLVAAELAQSQMLTINLQTLFDALTAEASLTGRIITLKANGTEPQILKPMLDAWVKVYLNLVESETRENNSDELLVADERLQLLELKIYEQQQRLQIFASENNITSLERDENRVLSQTKNLGANLDKALADESQAQALLNSLLEAINDGQKITRPADKAKIDATKQSQREINANLSALSEKYTQAYLERDPDIVAKQKKAQQLQILLEEQINSSQTDYLLDVKRDLSAAKGKVQQMNIQLVEQNKLAQVFSQNLEQYKRLDDQLKALQTQAQTLKNQQVSQEVSKPFDAKISLLEPAFFPDYAIGPNYPLNSLISVIVAVIVAIFALLLFSFIFKQKAPTSSNHFVVIPGQAGAAGYSNLGYGQHGQIAAPDPRLASEPVKLPPVPQVLRLLSLDECQLLFSVANNQGKALVGLILNGVSIAELLVLEKANFRDNYSKLQMHNQFSRVISVPKELTEALQALCTNLTDEPTIWANIKSLEDFVQLLVNIGHDAQMAFPEQLSLDVLRHTYLTYLASQGARLNDIEQVAGYTSPSDLALYRNVNQQGKLLDLEQIKTQYPFIETS